MSKIIQVENLSKRYFKNETRPHEFPTLRDQFMQRKKTRQEFWALRDLNFTLEQGEVLGVLGKNGAGKSTLFKILSRITKPTTGKALIGGRVSSLLEVGTGFHPELSGRENIFLNGTILGMSRAEIKNQFHHIVEFSGVAEFLDDPVKYYSSGMYMRLAFSIAAHLQSEILIIDEVLAVGDAQFQAQCLAKIKELVHEEGRTVLLVSHDLARVKEFCSQCLWLEAGRLKLQGKAEKVINAYQQELARDQDKGFKRS